MIVILSVFIKLVHQETGLSFFLQARTIDEY